MPRRRQVEEKAVRANGHAVRSTAGAGVVSGWMRRLVRSARPARGSVLEDLLYAAEKTPSRERLLNGLPRQICETFQLDQFVLFLKQGSNYIEELPEANKQPLSLRASSAVLVQLRRNRNLLSLAEENGDAWLMLARDHDVVELRRSGVQWLLACPGRTGLAGFAALGRTDGAELTRREARVLRDLAARIGAGLETLGLQRTLQEQAAERERSARRLELAREVQERMLPQVLPATPRLVASAAYRSVEEVGGDYYDAFWTPLGRICYVIADVSGKGVAAALLMSTLRSVLRTAMLVEPELPALLRLINQQLLEASSPSSYATLAILLYDPRNHMLLSSNAGHLSPLLLGRNGVRRLTCGGPVLGLIPEVAYEQELVELRSGEVVLLFTDGLTERTNSQGEEWGEEGLLSAATALAGQETSVDLLAHIFDEASRFAENTPQTDDATLLVLRSSLAEGRPGDEGVSVHELSPRAHKTRDLGTLEVQ